MHHRQTLDEELSNKKHEGLLTQQRRRNIKRESIASQVTLISTLHIALSVKMSSSRWEPWPLLCNPKNKQQLVKLFVSALLMAAAFIIIFSDYITFLPVSAPSAVAVGAQTAAVTDNVKVVEAERGPSIEEKSSNGDNVVPESELDINEEFSQKGKCDIFAGEWIHNPIGPAYTNATCPFIESPQDCIKNGRPDTGYLHWRWKPHDCDVALFDAHKFLNTMRNKSWALIGDSIFRNHVQSLLCLLSEAEVPVEVYHDETFKNRRWLFHSHNFTLSVFWSPFLVKADTFEDSNGKVTSEVQLHLDTLENHWTSQYHNFDYIVISGGQWFLKEAIYLENNTVVGCHACQGKSFTEMGLEYSYHKVLRKLYDFIATSDHKPYVIFRTWTPTHFENGQWFSGGSCNRTVPYHEGQFNGTVIDRLMQSIELEEFDKAAVNVPENGAQLKLLDTYYLSLLRPDGHSGPYRSFHPFDKGSNAVVQNDCLHWCLPGPVDTWNDLIMELVLNQ